MIHLLQHLKFVLEFEEWRFEFTCAEAVTSVG